MGKRTRMSFARIEEALPVPDLIEVQKNSYQHFLKVDLKEVLADVSPITDYNDTLVLEFIDYSLDSQPKNTVERCKERDQTFAAPLKVKVRLTNRETHDVSESEVFIGDFPLMTEHGTFVINGAERVIVSQLVRSPGVYYEKTIDKAGRFTYAAKMIPNRGAWLEYECDANDVFSVRIDRTRKVPITALLRALGLSSDADITAVLGEDERLTATFAADQSKNTDQALMEIYKRLRPGEPPTVDSARNLLNGTFFDPKKYDLARVGRYKYNKKLAIAARIAGRVLSQDVVNPHTAEVMAPAGTTLTREMAEQIQNVGVNTVFIQGEDREIRIVGNNFVRFDEFFKDYSPEMYEQYLREREEYIAEKGVEPLKLFERVHAPALQELIDVARADGAPILQVLTENVSRLIPKHVLIDDIISSVSYQLDPALRRGYHRRHRPPGQPPPAQRGRAAAEPDPRGPGPPGARRQGAHGDRRIPTKVRPQDLINIRPVSAAIKEFFGSSQLSQFMDQPNPLAELTHKRRLSALGPGGLNRDRASFEVRDVHYSHYARICPIETPEGPNIGLIGSLATYARINEYGFIEAPYRRVDHGHPLRHRRDRLHDRGRGRQLHRRPGQRAAGRRGTLPARARITVRYPRRDHRGGQEPRRFRRRVAPPAGLRRHRHDPLPGERRRKPRPDGLEHAAPGRAASGARGPHRGYRHRVQGRLRLGRRAPGPPWRRGRVRGRRPDRHPHRRPARRITYQPDKVRPLQPGHLHQPAPAS